MDNLLKFIEVLLVCIKDYLYFIYKYFKKID